MGGSQVQQHGHWQYYFKRRQLLLPQTFQWCAHFSFLYLPWLTHRSSSWDKKKLSRSLLLKIPLRLRFGAQPISCQPSWDGKATHKNPQAPQWTLLSSRLKFTAACRHLHLHAWRARPTQHSPKQMNNPPTPPSPPVLYVGSCHCRLTRFKLDSAVFSLLISHSPKSICCQFVWIHPFVISSLHDDFFNFHCSGDAYSLSWTTAAAVWPIPRQRLQHSPRTGRGWPTLGSRVLDGLVPCPWFLAWLIQLNFWSINHFSSWKYFTTHYRMHKMKSPSPKLNYFLSHSIASSILCCLTILTGRLCPPNNVTI